MIPDTLYGSWNDTPGRTLEEVLAVLEGRSDK